MTSGLWIDIGRLSLDRTKSMHYDVSVRINGTGPVLLVLPAPSDSRFWGALSVANGSSTLQLNHTSTDTYVMVLAASDVAFHIDAKIVAASWDPSLTRVTYQSASPYSGWNATIEMSASVRATTVLLDFEVAFEEYCYYPHFALNAVIHEGSAGYPVLVGAVVC